MKWNQVINTIRLVCFAISKESTQQAGMSVFITGTFQVKHEEGTCTVADTLVIARRSMLSGMYHVKRHTARQYFANGAIKTEIAENEEWLAVYQNATKQLLDIGSDRVFSFIPEERALLAGKIVYQKIAQ